MSQADEEFKDRPQELKNGAKRITRQFLHITSKVSVEPTIFLTMFTSIMYQLITQNLYLEKSCRVNIGFSDATCNALSNKNSSGYTKLEEAEVQKLVSQMLALRTAIQSFFPMCLILFIGSWSDRNNRRKPVILSPILGEIICCIFLILNVIFFYELPIIFTTLGDSLPLALLGGWPCLFVGVYTYIGTRCSKENRTIRVGIVSASKMAAFSLGLGVAGLIFKAFGFIGFFSLCIALLVIAFTLAMLLVQEESTRIDQDKKVGLLRDFFDIHHFKDTFKISFRSGPNNHRMKIIIIMILAMLVTGPLHGELNVIYMYTRYKFDWDAIHYGIFSSVQICVEICGSIMGVVFFIKYLHYDDTFLGIIGLTGTVLGNITFALAPNSKYFFLGIFVDFFRMTTYVGMRSMMSKIVPPNELGQSNSVFGLCEATMPLIFGPLYTIVYKYTIDVFPGTFFFFTVTIKFTGLCLFIWLYLMSLKEKQREKSPELKITKYKPYGSSEDITNEESNRLMIDIHQSSDDPRV